MTDWLTVNITPIFKKGNRSSPLDYRPIALTAVCCKVLEHIIYHHIMEHLSQYQIIHNYQHGFRQGYSAESELITVTEDIVYAMDHKLQTDAILLDFKRHSTQFHTSDFYLNYHLMVFKMNTFLDKLLAHSEEATSNCRWFSFCMDSSKIWCTTGDSVGTADVFNLY